MSYETYYNTSKTATKKIFNTKGKGIGIDTGLYVDDGNAKDNMQLPTYLSAQKTPVFQISMSDLFPFLKMNQLPLYMLRDPLFVELSLVSATSKKRLSLNAAEAADKTYNIDLNNVHMLIDHIYYPAEQMEAYAAANPQITLSYHDYSLSKQSLVPAAAVNNIRNIGGAGRIVTKIIHSMGNVSDNGETNPFNTYQSEFPDAGGLNINLNVRYNNEFLYPIDVTNTARIYNLTTLAEGMTPFTSRDGWNREGQATVGDEIVGYTQSTFLAGNNFYQAHRLNRNERVSGKGIELYTKYDTLSGSNYVQRAWVEYLKIATITNGLLDVYNA